MMKFRHATLLAILLTFAAISQSTALWADIKVIEADYDYFSADDMVKRVEKGNLGKIKDGIIDEYTGALSEAKEIKSFRKKMAKIRKDAIAMHRKAMGLPEDFKFHCFINITDRRKGDTSGNNMSATSREVGDTSYGIVSVYADHLIIGKVLPEITLVHELNHAMLREYLGPDYRKTPRWFREGLAVYLAGQRDHRIRVLLAGALNRSIRSLQQAANIVPMLINGLNDKHDFDDYAEDVLMIEFAVKQDANAIAKMIASVKAGKTATDAYAESIGMTWKDALSTGMNYARRTMYALEGGRYLAFYKAMQTFLAIEKEVRDADADGKAKAISKLAAHIKATDKALEYSSRKSLTDLPYTASAWVYYRHRGYAALGMNDIASAGLVASITGKYEQGCESTLTTLICRRIVTYSIAAKKFDQAEEWLTRIEYGMGYSSRNASFVITNRKALSEARAAAEEKKD